MMFAMGVVGDLNRPNRTDEYTLSSEAERNGAIPVLNGVLYGPNDYASIMIESPVGVCIVTFIYIDT